MRRLPLLTLLVFAAGAPSIAAAESPPIPLAKVSKWEMNYDVDSCHLLSTFGTGSQTTTISITRDQPRYAFDLTIASKLVESSDFRRPVEVTFGNQNKRLKRDGYFGSTSGAKKLPLVMIDDLRIDGWDDAANYSVAGPTISSAQEAAVDSIVFKVGLGKRYRLETHSLGPPLKALSDCTTDLVHSWGYDPAVQARLTKRAQPLGKPQNWFSPNDFPIKALAQGHNGLVGFRLDVDETGKVTGCRILHRTSPDEFADLSCKLLLAHAKMTPALDAGGKPVKSFFINRIVWQTRTPPIRS